VPHYLTYGSLIGAMRDRAINPFEVDNDIALPGGRVPKRCDRYLRENGIVMVEGRACTRAAFYTGSYSPFQSYYPYTDFYSLAHGPAGFEESWNVSTMMIGHHRLPVPPASVANAWLSTHYPDWTHNPAVRKRADVQKRGPADIHTLRGV